MARKVFCMDAMDYINSVKSFDSVLTSIPDREETDMSIEEWKHWFCNVVRKIVSKTNNYAIFYQTNRKVDGGLIDKSYLVNQGISISGGKLLWSKIALCRDVNASDLFRPTFTHILCASKKKGSGKNKADVIHRGKMIYKNAMGLNACMFCLDFIKNNSDTKVITDPFCGQGSILAIADKMGFETIGVDILEEQCEKSKKLYI